MASRDSLCIHQHFGRPMLLAISLLAATAGSVMAAAPVLVALSVPDVDAASRFYTEALDLRLHSELDFPEAQVRVALLKSADLELELMQIAEARPSPLGPGERHRQHGMTKFGVRVESATPLVEKLLGLGATVRIEPFDDPNSGYRITILADPWGNLLQLNEALASH